MVTIFTMILPNLFSVKLMYQCIDKTKSKINTLDKTQSRLYYCILHYSVHNCTTSYIVIATNKNPKWSHFCTAGHIILSIHSHSCCKSTCSEWVACTVYLVLQRSLWSKDFVKDVLSNMGVDSTEGIIQEVDVTVLIHSPCQTHSLLLPSTQVDALLK